MIAWAKRYKLDAVITILREVRDWVREAELDLPVARLSAQPGELGIDPDPERAAKAAFELLLLLC